LSLKCLPVFSVKSEETSTSGLSLQHSEQIQKRETLLKMEKIILALALLMVAATTSAMSHSRRSNGCPPICRKHCENGFEVDSNNCPICQCKCPSDPVVSCAMFCPRGFLKDDAGCDTCQCNECYSDQVSCFMECPNGYVLDKNGCSTCECRVCPPTCRMACPNGFETDEFDCEVCKCK